MIAAFTIASDLFAKGFMAYTDGSITKSMAEPHIDAVLKVMNNENEETGDSVPANDLNGTIRFEKVSFSYGDRPILDNVSFEIQPGDKVIISGPNGQGKSTLLQLISGLYRPSFGQIFINNNDICKLHINSINNSYAYIPQNPHILTGDSYENILLTSGGSCEEYLKAMNIKVSDIFKPEAFSQGEKQRITIARGIHKAKNTPIVLGDEIFANVDSENRERIAALLEKELKDKTVLFVCHYTMGFKFNKRLSVNNGKVTVEGI